MNDVNKCDKSVTASLDDLELIKCLKSYNIQSKSWDSISISIDQLKNNIKSMKEFNSHNLELFRSLKNELKDTYLVKDKIKRKEKEVPETYYLEKENQLESRYLEEEEEIILDVFGKIRIIELIHLSWQRDSEYYKRYDVIDTLVEYLKIQHIQLNELIETANWETIHKENEYGTNIIHFSAALGRDDIILWLYFKNFPIHLHDKFGLSALFYAALNKRVSTVVLLNILGLNTVKIDVYDTLSFVFDTERMKYNEEFEMQNRERIPRQLEKAIKYLYYGLNLIDKDEKVKLKESIDNCVKMSKPIKAGLIDDKNTIKKTFIQYNGPHIFALAWDLQESRNKLLLINQRTREVTSHHMHLPNNIKHIQIQLNYLKQLEKGLEYAVTAYIATTSDSISYKNLNDENYKEIKFDNMGEIKNLLLISKDILLLIYIDKFILYDSKEDKLLRTEEFGINEKIQFIESSVSKKTVYEANQRGPLPFFIVGLQNSKEIIIYQFKPTTNTLFESSRTKTIPFSDSVSICINIEFDYVIHFSISDQRSNITKIVCFELSRGITNELDITEKDIKFQIIENNNDFKRNISIAKFYANDLIILKCQIDVNKWILWRKDLHDNKGTIDQLINHSNRSSKKDQYYPSDYIFECDKLTFLDKNNLYFVCETTHENSFEMKLYKMDYFSSQTQKILVRETKLSTKRENVETFYRVFDNTLIWYNKFVPLEIIDFALIVDKQVEIMLSLIDDSRALVKMKR